jgi:hypothetical protein
MKRSLIITLVMIFGGSILPAQESFMPAGDSLLPADSIQKKTDTVKKKECKQGAIGDLFRKKEKAPKPPKKFMALVLPNISSNPTNGFLLGVGGSFGWYMGPKENTKVSSAPFTVAVTSKSQLITFLKHNIYTKGNQYFLQGDWKYYIYSQPTYGLGTNSPDTAGIPSSISWMGEGTNTDSVYFPMKFNYLRIHEIVNKRVIGDFYAGVGYHLDYYFGINDEDYRAATDTTPEFQTPHSFYSKNNNFNPKEYMVSGLSANFLYDSRDNQINPYKGYYANLNYRINPTFLGSSENSSTLWLEFRTYIGHLIGFWTFGDFLVTGKLPYPHAAFPGRRPAGPFGKGIHQRKVPRRPHRVR